MFYSFQFAAEARIQEMNFHPHVGQMRRAGNMQPVHRRDAGVWYQTKSLLYKNLLIKWRTKQQSLQVPAVFFFQVFMSETALAELICLNLCLNFEFYSEKHHAILLGMRCFKSSASSNKNCSKQCNLCLSLQELILPLLLLALLIAINNLNPHSYYGDISTVELEREDRSFKGLGYTPITNVTSSIMEQVAQEMSQSN